MKRTRTSMTLLLGIWMGGLVAAFMASRHSVFAGTGQNSCESCTTCVFTYTYWGNSTVTITGWLNHNTKAAEQSGFVGGTVTIYTSLPCELFQIEGGDQLDVVNFATATGDCIWNPPIQPTPVGYYTGFDGTMPSDPINTITQSWCNSD